MIDDPDNPDLDHSLDAGFYEEICDSGDWMSKPAVVPKAAAVEEWNRCKQYRIRFSDGRTYITGYIYR